jgi:hypothetical protein
MSSYDDDVKSATVARQASITASSTAAQIKTAEDTYYQRLYIAGAKAGIDNGAHAALQARGVRIPAKTETI